MARPRLAVVVVVDEEDKARIREVVGDDNSTSDRMVAAAAAVAVMVAVSALGVKRSHGWGSWAAGHQAVSLRPSKAAVSDREARAPPKAVASAAEEDAEAAPSIATPTGVPTDG